MFTSTKLIHLDYTAINNMVYPLMALENSKLTFEEYKKVLAGEIKDCYDEEDVRLAMNLEAACTYMLDTLNDPVNEEYVHQINEILTQDRVTDGLVRDYAIGIEDLEYIKILRACQFDFSDYDLAALVPKIPEQRALQSYLNLSKKEYYDIIHGVGKMTDEQFAYQCFVPMIRQQYFKKSNLLTGAVIVCKIVLQARSHLMFIEPKHKLDLAKVLLECIYYNKEDSFQQFVSIMTKHRVEMTQESSVKVMIHYEA